MSMVSTFRNCTDTAFPNASVSISFENNGGTSGAEEVPVKDKIRS